MNDIALKLNLTDFADGLHDLPLQRERNEIARRERTLANLRERALALIERHPDVENLFKVPVQATPTAGTAPFAMASTAALFAELDSDNSGGTSRLSAVTTGMARALGNESCSRSRRVAP